MRKPRPTLILAVAVPFLTGCFGIQAQPLPEPQARSSAGVRGLVVRDGTNARRIEFSRVDHVEWTDSTVLLVGVLKDPVEAGASGSAVDGTITSRVFPLSSISGVLVRQVDANRTSILIGAVAVGTIAIAALLLTGKTDDSTVLQGLRR